MVTTVDESARTRFATEIDRNFSVIASAGSGKTTAITQRILAIARSKNAADRLPRLVVVTFANRAADEMQQRTRQLLLQEKLATGIQTAFNRAFFGTIHSFCMKLLTEFGHYLGLPAPLELVEDDAELWQEFVQTRTRLGCSLDENNRAALLRLVQARDLMELGRRAGSAVLCPPSLPPFPPFDFRQIYEWQKPNENIMRSQDELRQWEERFAAGWDYLRWPVCFTAPNANFTAAWLGKFAPVRKWITDAAMCVAAEVQRDYREFRLERGLVTYGDQIALAAELLQHPVCGPRIRHENCCVILDEAQDTEPAQFSVLLEVARPTDASGEWMKSRTKPPESGRFCMVGDFQQSIYRNRADLPYYDAVHQTLISTGAGEALTFSVTFRLDEKQLQFVNETFRDILNGCNGQVHFVELHPRPEILPGTVIRLPLSGQDLLPEGKKLKEYQKARIEARYLASWLKNAGPKALSADSWRDVAVLCPRKAWLQTLAAAFRNAGLPVSIQSERDVKGDSPAYAWLTALLTVMSDPRNGYEIVGVLREVFGVSDHDLAVFAEGGNNRFVLDAVRRSAGKVSSHLRLLGETREQIQACALFDAVSHVVRETQLRERLLLLPSEEFGELDRELDALLAQAAEAEANGLTLAEFAEFLRDDFGSARAVRFLSDENAIQLITSHKAKGSEWQAVILPFLARDLRQPSLRYPHLVKTPRAGDLAIALGKEDKSKELKDAVETAYLQELERLLYVATTRARRTLVVVLDQEIFCPSDRKLAKTAQLRQLIRGADVYTGQFDRNTTTLPEPTPAARDPVRPNESPPAFENIDQAAVRAARTRAGRFVRKMTPSGLAADTAEDAPAPTAKNEAGLRYGQWWHNFFEQLDWSGGADPAQLLFEREVHNAPDAAAAATDWDATRSTIFDDPLVAQFLQRPARLFQREFPFSWRINDRTVIEGFIDWLIIDPEDRHCMLVDWKTNRVSRGEAESLRSHYRPQLAGYWKALKELTRFEVTAALFSTALGRYLPYQTAELESEWNRLEQLPPMRLEQELRPDDL